ncbi:MAG: BON domain-containing protein [Hydrogenophaga sp.]|nr:BON domain-containing protein [Hydrogenophaga sp.]
MKHTTMSHRVALVLATTAAAFALAACGQESGEMTAGQKLDSAIASTQNAASEVKQEVGQTVDEVKQSTAEMTASAETAVSDMAITTKVSAALAADDQLKALQIHVDSRDGHVTMTGPAPDAASRDRATVLAKAVDGVVSVDNRLVVDKG